MSFETTITNKATGAVTLEKFTSSNEPYSITRGYGTAVATTETLTYNEEGRMLSRTDGNGHETTYTYDSHGNRPSMVDPDKGETKWTYDETHDIETETLPGGENRRLNAQQSWRSGNDRPARAWQ
jgi:YD repeat-containing protein